VEATGTAQRSPPPEVRESAPRGGSNKAAAGYTFPFGDYAGLAVDPAGTNFVIWGEGNGIYTGGDTGGSWWVRGR
jgi:hypothetical protein